MSSGQAPFAAVEDPQSLGTNDTHRDSADSLCDFVTEITVLFNKRVKNHKIMDGLLGRDP